MKNLLYAEFSKLKENLFFMTCVIGMFALGLIISLCSVLSGNLMSLESIFNTYIFIVPALCAVLSIQLQIMEYECGAVRNKVICGHKRINIYLANLIVYTFAGFIISVVYFLPMTIFKCISSESLTSQKIPEIVLFILLIMMYISLFTLICSVVENKITVFSVCLMILIPVIVVSINIFRMIYSEYYYNNSYYIEINMQIFTASILILFITVLLSYVAGIILFCKKDLK